MEFKRVLVRRKFLSLSYLHDLLQHSCHRRAAINVQRVRIFSKCRTSNHRVQRVCHRRQWLSVHSLAWARSPPDGDDRFAVDKVHNCRPTIKRNGPHRMIVRVNDSPTPNICILMIFFFLSVRRVHFSCRQGQGGQREQTIEPVGGAAAVSVCGRTEGRSRQIGSNGIQHN